MDTKRKYTKVDHEKYCMIYDVSKKENVNIKW